MKLIRIITSSLATIASLASYAHGEPGDWAMRLEAGPQYGDIGYGIKNQPSGIINPGYGILLSASGMRSAAGLDYHFDENFRLGLAISYSSMGRNNFTVSANPNTALYKLAQTVEDNTLSLTAKTFSLLSEGIYEFQNNYKFTPFAGLGMGINHNKITAPELAQLSLPYGPINKASNNLDLHFCLGMSYRLNNGTSLYLKGNFGNGFRWAGEAVPDPDTPEYKISRALNSTFVASLNVGVSLPL